MAVELAQYEYAMPRLKRLWTHLSRQKKGVGLRGPGETQLEEDRRLVENRIKDLRRQLTAIGRRKQREVAARRDLMTVSLVGYTNAGKSTLMNALTGADVFVQDALFATLDTRTRRWQLPGWGPVLLSDTVGFIRDLPHHLIESFKATLEEARQADLLLHVADAANPAVYDQITAAYDVLEEIGIQRKDSLLVVNKVDALPDRLRLDGLLGAIRRGAHQCPDGLGAHQSGRRGERRAEPQLPQRRRRVERGQRPAAGLPGRPRRSPLEAVPRQPGGGPLPDSAALPWTDQRRFGVRPSARQRSGSQWLTAVGRVFQLVHVSGRMVRCDLFQGELENSPY